MNYKGDPSSNPVPAISDSQKSTTARIRAIPLAHQSIQANFCKTPGCNNFGVPPRTGLIQTGRGNKASDGYNVVSAGSLDLSCKRCGKFSTIKSNKAIAEELQRQGDLIWQPPRMRCPNDACTSHSMNDATFRKFGSTRSGSPRFQCSACKSTFSIGKSTLRQRQPHKNTQVFELLVNKSPMNRMLELTGLSVSSLYGKINFIYEQCRLFAADRERQLAAMKFERLYLCTDRQDYLVNWPDKAIRKTIQLTAIATADLDSGYIFGLTPNYDPSITQNDLEALWAASDDQSKPLAMRETARLWTRADYDASTVKSTQPSPEAQEPAEDMSEGQQLPKSGCQVHADYLMYGHYWLLRHQLQGAGKIRFFLDGEAGLLAACMCAFVDRVNARTADIAVVCIEKELTVDARNAALAKARKWFRAERARFPALSERQARSAIMTEIIAAARSNAPDGCLKNSWIRSPFPDLAEPNKRIRFVTDLGDYDDAHAANILLKATLWPIDSVFNHLRRRLSHCERPVNSARRANRRWHIYAPYDPEMVNKVLTIFRVWHNYVWIGKKSNETAAERLGLAQGKIKIQDILSFAEFQTHKGHGND